MGETLMKKKILFPISWLIGQQNARPDLHLSCLTQTSRQQKSMQNYPGGKELIITQC